MKLSNIISTRNILRASGTIAVLVGTPMVIVPPLIVRLLFGKRESTQPDKNALNLTLQALGIALIGSGLKSIAAPVTTKSLSNALFMEALYACYHCSNTAFGRWKNANADMRVAHGFLVANIGLVTLQVLSLCCGQKPEKDD